MASSSSPVTNHTLTKNTTVGVVKLNHSISNSRNGGNVYKELKHLVEKSTLATLDLALFRKLKRESIGNNEVESIASGLVQAKLAKEGIYKRMHNLGDESAQCWRNVSIVNTLLDYKVKELKKF